MSKTITPPSDLDDSDKRAAIDTLAKKYGQGIEQVGKRSDTQFDYAEWIDTLHQLYPITDYSVITSLIEEYPTPHSLTADSDESLSLKTGFTARFLRIVAADLITTAYLNDTLSEIPPKLFHQLFETPDHQPEPITMALAVSALGNEHPDVGYQAYLMSDAIEDQPGLVLHLQLLWVINPDDLLTYWERIQSEGHPTVTNEDLYNATTWNAEIASSFAGSILGYPDLNITGIIRYPYVRGDQIKEKVGYPHDDSVFEELAELTTSYVDLDNIKYDSTINNIRSNLP